MKQPTRCLLPGVFALLLVVLSVPAEEKPPAPIVLTGARLIDGNGGSPIDDAVIVIEGNRFAAAGPKAGLKIPANAEVIDVKGRSVIPGLIDAHIHFSAPLSLPAGVKLTPAYAALWSREFLRNYLQCGITTVCDVAGFENVTIPVRQAFEAGLFQGSRPIVCGQGITSSGGHGTEGGGLGVMEVDGPDGFRTGVRTQLHAGADIIKVLCPFSREEILAAVDEAHHHEKFIAVHPSQFKAQYDFLRWTVEAGADRFEHAYAVPDDVIPEIAAKKMFVVPTMSILIILGDQYEKKGPGWDWKIRKYRECDDIFKKLKSAGVKMAVGTDAINENLKYYPGLYFLETDRFVHNGCTPMETIVAATKTSAEACDAGTFLGTIEKGKIADLLVLDKDPLADIKNLRTAAIIIQNGRIVKR